MHTLTSESFFNTLTKTRKNNIFPTLISHLFIIPTAVICFSIAITVIVTVNFFQIIVAFKYSKQMHFCFSSGYTYLKAYYNKI